MTTIRRTAVHLAAVLLLGAASTSQEPVAARRAWSEAVVELFARLPVQDGGRVKPLDTYAQFRLLRFNGRRSLATPAGERLGATSWLLDCFFFPELARGYRVFLVRDSAVLEAIGVRVEGRKKSDRYAYDELRPGREQLFSEAARIGAIEPKSRTSIDAQLHALAVNLRDFEELTGQLAFARQRIDPAPSRLLAARLGSEPLPAADFLERLAAVQADLRAELEGLPDGERAREGAALTEVSQRLEEALGASGAALFPPPSLADDQWHGVDAAFAAGSSESLELLRGWEALEGAKGDPAAFEERLADLAAATARLAERRGEYSKVPLEVAFYRGDYFTRALVAFLAGFLCLAGSWLAPRSRWLVRGVWALAGLGTALVVVGVVLRCVIRARPPVSTLYETILFITGCCALVLLVIEWMQRTRVALALTPVLGAAGMFLAMKYELKEAALAGDTMPSLVAVLDTNFWLATHVTTITLGYAAGLLAAVLGNLWLIGKMAGLKRGDAEFYRGLTRTTYGVICFGLLFSTVGTILGGVWANYSWGRFWGWDPKENGALLICIGQILTLHARLGGYVRQHGLAVLAALNGLAVAFSWWHVNNLGVGLHSYGKTDGVLLALYTYYGIGALVVAASFVWRLGARAAGAPAAGTSA